MPSANALPVGLALFAAVLWGLWWIPVHYLNSNGLSGAWASLAVSLAACPVLLAMLLLGSGMSRMPPKLLLGAALAALAITAYTTALDHTDVVRVVLLFYLCPAWSTLIECRFMGRSWTWQSVLALSCSLAGLFLILGGDLTSGGVGFGELLALVSGLLWAVGSSLLFTSPAGSAAQLSLLSVALAAVASLAAALLGSPSPEDAMAVIRVLGDYPVYVIGSLFFGPMIAITIWAAWKLPPALMSYLLSTEIISGVVSSVILLDERFGAFEFFGAVAILLGATIELMLPRREKAK